MSLSVDIEKRLGDFFLQARLKTEGGVTGLLGASGCGKSYTLKCVAGIEKPDRGHIELDGRVLFDSEKHINLPPQKRRVGYLFQNYALFPNMDVRKNILCGLRAEKDRLKREKACREIISLLQLEGLENHRPAQLSGGQAQRVALARILVSDPDLLMLDEPFSALDSHLREKLQIEMRGVLRRFDRDVLMVTHSRDEAYHLCADIGVMDAGKILRVSPAKQLFADPGSVCAASLTGCKNIAPAVCAGEYQVDVPGWGLRLTCAQKVRPDVCAVGIRAHYFHPNARGNRFPVRFVGEMEEPFEWIFQFRWDGQDDSSPEIWWRVPKDKAGGEKPRELGVAPQNILLLYP